MATQRATLADICRGRARRPPSLLRPRFLRRGVAAPPPDGGGGGSGGSPARAPSSSSSGVVFDEVLFEVADTDVEGGGGPSKPVPMWVARPSDEEPTTTTTTAEHRRRPPVPAVLWLHGKGENRGAYLPVAARFAARGCLFAAPDMPYHGGGRRREDASASSAADADAFDAAVARAIREGSSGPLLLDWAWDGLCALDVLKELYGDDLLSKDVVLAGTSMGGSAALLLAAALSSGDERGNLHRIKACIPLIALQSWRWGLENGDAWMGRAESLGPALQAAVEVAAAEEPSSSSSSPREAWRRALLRLLPGILTDYDAPRVLAALRSSGTSLLACNSASDPRCPLGGVRAAWQEAEVEAAKAAAATPTKHELFVDASARGHELTPAMMARAEMWLAEEVGLFG